MAFTRRATDKDATYARAWTADTLLDLTSISAILGPNSPKHGDIAFVTATGFYYLWMDDDTWQQIGAGVSGPVGPQGIPGLDGNDGEQGEQGIQGNPGPTGATGNTGPAGLVGPPGIDGIDGEDGLDGINGIQGIQGITGINGSQGPQGIPGIDGLDGADGIDGVPGIQGNQGVSGVAGVQGPIGPPGLDAEENEYPYIIPGDRGPQGPAGGGGGGSATTVEVNLGATAKWSGSFTITDAGISGTSKILAWQAPGPYTGKGTRADEAQMAPVSIIAVSPGAGSAIAYWETPPMITKTMNARSQYLQTGTTNIVTNPKDPVSYSNGTARRLGRVRGNVKFSYVVFA